MGLLQTCSFSLHNFTRCQLMDWSYRLLVDYCVVFISCLNSHSDGTHLLRRNHWWGRDVLLNFSKSVLMKKQTSLHFGLPEREYIFSKFSFWVNYSFKSNFPKISFLSCIEPDTSVAITYTKLSSFIPIYILMILQRGLFIHNLPDFVQIVLLKTLFFSGCWQYFLIHG